MSKRINALVICDDFYHSGEIVKAGTEFLNDEFKLDFMTDMSDFKVSRIFDYDMVAICKDNQISPYNNSAWCGKKEEKAFTDYAEKGGGILAIHAGTVLCKKSDTMKAVIGCAFSHHPEQCNVEYIVSEHFITGDAVTFIEKDEHYFVDFTAEDAVVFLHSSSEHGTTSGYVRVIGKGRVCVLTPGHNLEVWQNKEYKKILRNAFIWCVKQDSIQL